MCKLTRRCPDSLPLSLRVKISVKEDSFRPSDLLAQFKQIGTGTRAHIRAAELLDNTVEVIREMVYTHTLAQPKHTGIDLHTNTQCPIHWVQICMGCFYSVSVTTMWLLHGFCLCVSVCVVELLSMDDIETLLEATGCSTEIKKPVCKGDCLSERYRSITGHCNNRYSLNTAETKTKKTPTSNNRCTLTGLFTLIGSPVHLQFPIIQSQCLQS